MRVFPVSLFSTPFDTVRHHSTYTVSVLFIVHLPPPVLMAAGTAYTRSSPRPEPQPDPDRKQHQTTPAADKTLGTHGRRCESNSTRSQTSSQNKTFYPRPEQQQTESGSHEQGKPAARRAARARHSTQGQSSTAPPDHHPEQRQSCRRKAHCVFFLCQGIPHRKLVATSTVA